MDPISTTLLAALGKLAEPAVRDTYESLKRLLARKFPRVNNALSEVETTPASQGRRMTLNEEVQNSGAESDPEIIASIKALSEMLRAHSTASTIVTQSVTGDANIFSGTGNVRVQR